MAGYEDFSIRIGRPRETGEHEVTVDAMGRSTTELVRIPYAPGELEEIFASLDAEMYRSTSLAFPRDEPTRDMGREPGPSLSENVGKALFDALFAGKIKSVFDSMLKPGATILRIRLQLDLESVGHVAGLPWELMYYHAQRHYLARSNGTTVVRYIDRYLGGSPPGEMPPFEPPLRILFVAANPNKDLKLEEETNEIRRMLAGVKGQIDPTFLENVTSDIFRDTLEDNDYHIIHFMGHGEFTAGEGALVFEDRRVPGSELGPLLSHELKHTRLVVLNACRTAEFTREQGRDPFAGVATAIVMAGIPAVVAMQFPIADRAAIAFAARFYSKLAVGNPVEEAVDAGRRQLSGTSAWATPVLFSRRDGDLFRKPVARPDMPRSKVDVSDLLPYMPDCSDALMAIDEAIHVQSHRPGRPLLAIVHGADEQCLDKFQERLEVVHLPRKLGLEARQVSIKPYGLEWPKLYQPADFEKKLTWALANQVDVHATTVDELHDYLATFPCPIMICTHLLADQWVHHGEPALRAYLDWWQAWPGRAAHLRLLVFLFIKYNSQPSGWWARRQTKKLADTIRSTLASLDPSSYSGLAFTVTKRLESISEQDVHHWNVAQGHPLSDEQITSIFRSYRATTRRDHMPMKEIAKRLQAALSRRAQPIGGLA